MGSLYPFKTDERSFDDASQLRWVVNRPKLYHCYRVRWQWNGTNGAP